jgi:hypothetical protein
MSDPEPSIEQSAMNTQGLLRIATAIETAATLDELLMLALNEFVPTTAHSIARFATHTAGIPTAATVPDSRSDHNVTVW